MLNSSAQEPRLNKPSYHFSGTLPVALQTLASKRQWVCWEYAWSSAKRKWDKPPLSAHTGRLAKGGINSAANLGTFAEAAATAARLELAGVGFVLGPDDDVTGIDLDDCITASDSFSPLATTTLSYQETYAEIPPSGEGIRMFALGKPEKATTRCSSGPVNAAETPNTKRVLPTHGAAISCRHPSKVPLGSWHDGQFCRGLCCWRL